MSGTSKIAYFLFVVFISFILSACGTESSDAKDQNKPDGKNSVSDSNTNIVQGDEYCLNVYNEVLEKYKQDYISCLSNANVELRQCPKPDGFDDGYRENLNIVIALDASGSMNGKVAGKQKMEAAKQAINNFVNTLPERADVGLIVYGHKGSNSESRKQESCAGVEPIYPVGKLNKNEFTRVVNSFDPTGWTPLASAIEKSGEILNGQTSDNSTNLVYVVSDGIETCSGNPVQSARRLNQSNIKAVVNIIGFDVDNAAQTQLKEAASAGGGQYFDAKNADELNKVFGGVSKSVAEYRQYLSCMTANKQDVKRIYGNKEAEVGLCVFNKSNKESHDIFMERLKWSRDKDQRDKCASFIIENQDTREKRIRNWRDEFINKIKSEKEITYEQLERELKEVTEKQKTRN